MAGGPPSWAVVCSWLVRRVEPHRLTPRLPAGDNEVPPDGLVRMQRLSARAQAPPPHNQRPAGPSPFVPVPAPLRIRPTRPLHAHATIRTLVRSRKQGPARMRVLSWRDYGTGA